MKKFVKILLPFLVLTTFVACSKPASNSAPVPTIDDELAGSWKLERTSERDSKDKSLPRVISFEINTNGLRQADYCDFGIDAMGMGDYDVQEGRLVIPYYTYQDPEHPRKNEMPTTKKEISAQITRLDANTLELDGKYTYTRIAVQSSGTSPNEAELCKDQE